MIPRINLQAKTESEYYKEQSGIAANLRSSVVWWRNHGSRCTFAAMNTMYAAGVGATTEIGTLRAFGFTR